MQTTGQGYVILRDGEVLHCSGLPLMFGSEAVAKAAVETRRKLAEQFGNKTVYSVVPMTYRIKAKVVPQQESEVA